MERVNNENTTGREHHAGVFNANSALDSWMPVGNKRSYLLKRLPA